jgi:hypothetical protein
VSSAEHVDMQVIDRLTAVATVVHHEAVAALGYSLPFRKLHPDGEQLPDERLVGLAQVRDGRDVFASQEQDVGGRLRRDVSDRHDGLIRVNLGRGQFTRDDAAEETV